MLKISKVAMIAMLTIGVASIVVPTIANAAVAGPRGCTANPAACLPPGGDPGGGGPGPGDPGGNEPGDEGDPDDGPGDPGDGGPGDPGDGPGDPGDGPGDPGDGGNPGPDGIPNTGDEPKLVVALDCAIKDDAPVTNDLWLVNVGTADLEAGMKIRYNIPATGDHGSFYLPRDIAVGEEGRLTDFISEIPVGEECRVEIIA